MWHCREVLVLVLDAGNPLMRTDAEQFATAARSSISSIFKVEVVVLVVQAKPSSIEGTTLAYLDRLVRGLRQSVRVRRQNKNVSVFQLPYKLVYGLLFIEAVGKPAQFPVNQ